MESNGSVLAECVDPVFEGMASVAELGDAAGGSQGVEPRMS